MKLARTRSTAAAACPLAALTLLTACNRDSSSGSAGSAGDEPAIGIDLPRSGSDFWNSYAEYLKK